MRTRLPRLTALVFTLAAIALAAVFYLAGTEGDPEGFGSAIGVAAPIAGGGLMLAMAIGRQQRWLVVTLGVVLSLFCVVYYVLIPLVALTVYVMARHGWWPRGLEEGVVGLWAAAAVAVPSGVVLFRETPVEWSNATSSGGASDIVTTGEATFSIVVVIVGVVTTLAWSRARA